jgi:arylsulfatase A-like enzyme
MNIILVVIDTLRYDYIAAHGKNEWVKTPNLDRLARSSLVFDRAYSSSYPTIPQRTDVMTGRYGSPFNPWMPLRYDITTLPRLLSDAGYCTQLIHDTPHMVNGGGAFDWPFHAWTFVRGAEVDRPWIDDKGFTYLRNWESDAAFDALGDPALPDVESHMLYTYVRANRNRIAPEDWNAARLFLTVSQFLRDNASRDNFFLWVDCFDPHGPEDSPPEYMRMYDDTPGYNGTIDPRALLIGGQPDRVRSLSDAGQRRLKAMYPAKVSHLDRWFGEMLDALDETGLSDNTAIVLTADHGVCTGEFSLFTKRVAGIAGEQEGHVPLLVRVPGVEPGRRDLPTFPQDLFRTIAGLAGVTVPDTVDGVDLLGRTAGVPERTQILGAAPNHGWSNEPNRPLFSVFGDTHYLNFAPNPQACRLFAYGSTDEVAVRNPDAVESLRRAGLRELERRGTDGRLIEWMRREGTGEFPRDACDWPGPTGWQSYWGRNYDRWG